jgi:triosephosphate isomerase
MQDKKFIIANWKMNGQLSKSIDFVKNINYITDNKEIIICPPCILIKTLIDNSPEFIKFGAQDCSINLNGAFTGDISSDMIYDIGCKYVIIGHSERRRYNNETIDIIKLKINNAIRSKLIPVICIGESKNDRINGNYLKIIEDEISLLSLDKLNNEFIIAYEPIWSIGDVAATIEQIEEIIKHVNKLSLNSLKIIYGGSVNDKNIADILNIDGNSGVLIGNASLDIDKFNKMINI